MHRAGQYLAAGESNQYLTGVASSSFLQLDQNRAKQGCTVYSSSGSQLQFPELVGIDQTKHGAQLGSHL